MKRIFAVMALCVVSWGTVWAAEPSLFVRVERKAVDDLEMLRKAGVPVVMETLPCLFVLGEEADVAALRDRGYDVRVLDREAATADYVIVGLRPDSDVELARATGIVLLEEENWLLIRLPAGTGTRAFERARVILGVVPEDPADPPEDRSDAAPERLTLTPDPIVQKVVNSLSNTDIQQTWQTLATNAPTGTRFSTSSGCVNAATSCYDSYVAYGVPVQYQTHTSGHAPNVIGTHEGAINPGAVYIMVGHLDDLPSSGIAPGANDNASGSAAVLQAAKVLSCWGVRNTTKFLNVTGEEQGLYGSTWYATDAAARGENIRGVLNFDMIGWQGNGVPTQENLDLNYNAPSQWLAQRFVDAAANYGTGLAVNPLLCPSLTVSDHYPFWQRGWSALCGITDNEGYCSAAGNYPYYHTANDTIANNGNPAFFYSVVRAAVATLAELAEPFKITFDQAAYACVAPVRVLVADRDLNTNPGTLQTVAVNVSSTSEPAGETLFLTERNVNAMIFEGALPTTSAPANSGDGLLTVLAGDIVTAQYVDAADCDGAANIAYAATAGVDCVLPVISNVSASAVTGNSALVNWTTDEPATSVVHYGTSAPGSSTASNAALVTTHAVPLSALTECTPYIYWVESADGVGNTTFNDAGGAYYGFTTGKNTVPSYPSTDTPIAIPDSNATGITSTINVPDSKPVQDVNVTVNITHTYDGDLTLSLLPPVGSAIALATRRGSSGDNFVNTVFDDQAATAISSGTAPFTGSFRPETPLSAANGISSLGPWRLKVADGATTDVGTLNNWTLTLTFPSAQCGPHAAYESKNLVQDTCSAGGPGSADGRWDSGETVQFNVRIGNDGTTALTGITVSLVPTTAGVVMLDAAAAYPDLVAGASADALAPYFTAKLPTGLACGSPVGFDVTIQSAEGSWAGSLSHPVGVVLSGGGTVLDENFSGGIPATWTIVDGGTGGGAAATWTTANPGARTAAAPMVNPLVIVDSDNAGSSATQNEELITPVMNLSTATGVTLEFDQYFRWYSSGQAEKGDVDVRSTLTGGAWVNVLRNQGASGANPDHKTLNISAQAAGAADVQVRFRYYDAGYEWYWQVDNVKATFAAPGGCQTTPCNAPSSAPPPVPDGSFGSPMRADRAAADGSTIGLTWDATSCPGVGYKAIFGPLSGLSSYATTGAVCGLGNSGTSAWTAVPAGNLWYVVVATDGAGTEGTWGESSAGTDRGGVTPSLLCGDTSRVNGGTCP